MLNFEVTSPFLLSGVDKGELPFIKKLTTVGERDRKM